MPAALFGITNSGLSLFVNLLILFLIVVWIALIAWTYLDARRRISDPVLIACATGASLFPYVGTIIYTILRPPEFLDDARERDLEMKASQLRVRQLEEQSCPNCGFPIERTYLRCPSCRVRVKDPCDSCGKPIDPRWTLCPYCETPVRRSEAAQKRRPSSRGERSTAPPSRPRKQPAERAARSGSREDRKAPRPASRSGSSRAAAKERSSSRSKDGSSSSTSSSPSSSEGGRSSRRDPSGGRRAPASES
jgi:hypothetical protein